MTDPIYNPPSFFGRNAIKLPSQYRPIKFLGAGSYGEVVKCWKKDINQPVAVKIPLNADDDGKEIPMMQELMRLKADQHNIIKFLGWFNTRCGKARVFEMCDISIMDYILKTSCAPMRLSDISTIIKQLAEALKALKRIGVIHNDLKLDNIMMVNHRIRPFKVKLIDFGLALPTSEAKQGMDLLTINSSPEMILDLPFSEAIDMWSLGCAMATMIIGDYLLFGSNAHETMYYNVEILGQPPDRLLDDGLKTEDYFTRTESNSWRLKTLHEYLGENSQRPYSPSPYSSLDDLRQLRLEENNKNEAVERGQCIDLLKAMLEMDQAERITPSEVLSHPFIDKGHQSSCEEPSASTAPERDDTTSIHQEHDSPASLTILPSGVILVHPAAPENTLLMEDEESAETALEKDATVSIHQEHNSPASLTVLPSGVILVHPAAPENTLLMEDEESAETALEKDATVSIHQEHHSPASLTVLPSGVILVQPAAPENTLLMEDEESAETALEKDATVSIHQEHHSPASLTVLPSGVILVQPAAPENTLLMEDEESAETALEKDATVSIHQEHHSPASLTVLPSGVILVQPAAPENTLLMEDEESAETALEKDATVSIHQEHHSPASLTVLPSGVILVHPAAPENTHLMEDEESAETALEKDATVSIHQEHHSPASLTVLPSGVILVQPAAPENTLLMEDEESAETALEKDATVSIHQEHHSPASLTVLPSGVILVQPAAPENTLLMEDEESAVRLQAETESSSVEVADSDTWTCQDSTSCDDTGTQQKKKKNCVRRFFSWMRKTFTSCCTAMDDGDMTSEAL